MKQIITTISANDLDRFNDEANHLISQDFEPLFNIVIAKNNSGEVCLFQQFHKYVKPEINSQDKP